MKNMPLHIKSMNLDELEQVTIKLKQAKFRGKQLFDWLHKKKVVDYNHMTNLPKAMTQALEIEYPLDKMEKVHRLEDPSDQTVKYLFKLADGQLVETVLMKYKYGYSVCISSQVGCRMGCTFCASTIGGLLRHLSASEMLEQVYYIERELDINIHSVVVMGTGEPFDNYNELYRFVTLLSHENGRHLSRRNITVSTCGIIDKIKRVSEELPQINLAISLHSPYQEARREVMPISNKYPLEELIAACKDYTQVTKRRITFEYSMIKGVNDSKKHGEDLGKLLKGMLCHVNLIPVNPVDEKDYEAAKEKDIRRFKEILERFKIPVTIRRSLGQNIDAACGQLRNRYSNDQG